MVFFPLVNDTFRKYKEPGKPWEGVDPPTTHAAFYMYRDGWERLARTPSSPDVVPMERTVGLKLERNIVPLERRMQDHPYALSMTFIDLAGVERSSAEMAQGNVDVSGLFSPYCINSFTYTEEQFDNLVKLTSYNIQNNKHLILQALNSAIEQKRQHKK